MFSIYLKVKYYYIVVCNINHCMFFAHFFSLYHELDTKFLFIYQILIQLVSLRQSILWFVQINAFTHWHQSNLVNFYLIGPKNGSASVIASFELTIILFHFLFFFFRWEHGVRTIVIWTINTIHTMLFVCFCATVYW